MTKMRLAGCIWTVLLCMNCGGDSEGDGDNGGKGPSGVEGARGSCESLSDCGAGETCIAEPGGSGACVPTCSVNGNDCSGTATCDGVATLSVNVCKTESSNSESSSGSSNDEEEQSEDLYIPCKSDEECQAVGAGAICAKDSYGQMQCAEPCTRESDCSVPSVGGITVDFFACQEDKSNSSRKACMFDPECDTDPLSCTSGIPGIGGGDSGGGGGGTTMPDEDFDFDFDQGGV